MSDLCQIIFSYVDQKYNLEIIVILARPTEERERLAEFVGLWDREQTLNWIRKYFKKMDGELQSPLRTRSPLMVALPRTPEERTADLEAAVNRIHISFEQEVSGLHKALRDMDAAHQAEKEEAGHGRIGHGRGELHQGQSNFEGRDPVKAIGDVRRTMHGICQIPKLSHATLSDFDQWKQ